MWKAGIVLQTREGESAGAVNHWGWQQKSGEPRLIVCPVHSQLLMPNPKPSTRSRRDAFYRDVASHNEAPLFGDQSQHKQSLMTTDRAVR